MSRYCQLKLIDVLKPEMSKNKSKRTVVKTFPSESKSTKTRLGNLSLLKIKNDISCDVTNDLTETRETRLTKKLNNPKKSNVLIQDVYVDSGGLRKLSESKTETTAGKRKMYDKVKNIEEPSSKKICSSESTHIQSSNNPDKRISQSRKRKRKPRESCWENKLTGARRVSKRLSNIRMERKKSLRSLGSTEEVSFESRQPINFSARGKIKPIKEDRNPTKRRKPYYRNHPEVQFNFGKLSHTKRFYPKVAPGRRPATYTVTIKPTGFIQQSPRKRNKGNYEHITYNRFEDINDSDINSLINKYVEDIQDEIVNEAGTKELSDSDITEDKETDKSNDQSTSKETTEESIVEAVPQESEVQTLVCGTVEEEFIDGSTIVIVDIESGENVECGTSEENVECGTSEENVECGTSEENTRDKQISVSERNYEVTKLSEEKSDLGEPSGDVTLIDLKHDQSEEKSNDIESNGLNTNRSEADIKPETTNYESAPTTVESSVSSPVTETIDITNTAD